jgi:hypothetical protein
MKNDNWIFGIAFELLLFLPLLASSQHQGISNARPGLIFSHPQGFYTSDFNLSVTNIPLGAELHYTIDGLTPDLNSPEYSAPIPVASRNNAPNAISLIPTNPLDTPYPWYVWMPPLNPICKANIIKFKLFYNGQPLDETTTLTYFVDSIITQRYHDFAVLSLVTDSLNLFGYDSGIYVPGLHYDLGPSWSWWGGDNANYLMRGDEWERPANLTFFEGNGTPAFQQDVGIRIHGGGTRVYPQKSLRIYARSEYGQSKINYRFFPEKDVDQFKRVIFHNNGQDFINGSMNDVIADVLVRHLDLDLQSFRPAIVFINGEYWGMHSIRDRLDEYYLEYSHGTDPDNVDIIEGNGDAENGDTLNYRALIHFIEENDLLDDENYGYVETQIDIPAYIDYVISKQYMASDDWPGNNVTCWRERTEGSKWRWFFYDNNTAFWFTDENSIARSIAAGGTQWPNPDWSTLILRNLLRNNNFKQQYIDRFEYHLQNTFTPERIVHYIDSITDMITPVLEEHIQRWNYPESIASRDECIAHMKQFAVDRPAVIRHELETIVGYNYQSDSDQNLLVYYSAGQIQISIPLTETVSYRIIDIEGRCLGQGELSGRSQYAIPSPIKAGVMLVQITLSGKVTSKKVVVF